MSGWPGNPIGSMSVSFRVGPSNRPPYQTEAVVSEYATLLSSSATTQTLTDPQLDFIVSIESTNIVANFHVKVERKDDNGAWVQIAEERKTLNVLKPKFFGDISDVKDTLTVSVTMTQKIEMYRISIDCDGAAPLGYGGEIQTEGWGRASQIYTAILDEISIGDFTLDFIPVGIVYCPPGHDMTNSVTFSDSFGTRFTLGTTGESETKSGTQATVDFLGLLSGGVAQSDSQKAKNLSSTGIEVSFLRNVTVTADNKQAVNKEHNGPLGDLFIILVNPRFQVSERAKGSLFYSLSTVEQVIVAPAWKLLRPDSDPIVSWIPAGTRKAILELDPFIRHLDQFFPTDLGADLGIAANPRANPSVKNRAELMGRWWPDSGSEIIYSIGETHKLFSTQTNEASYAGKFSLDAKATVSSPKIGDLGTIKGSLGVSEENTLGVGFQSSRETTNGFTRSVSCFIVRSETDTNLEGIEIYFDKIFSSLMFRQIPACLPRKGCQRVGGMVTSPKGIPLSGLSLTLRDQLGNIIETNTSAAGRYSFPHLDQGQYTLEAGDQRVKVIVPKNEGDAESPSQRIDITGVKRVLELSNAHLWELQDVLGLSSEIARQIAPRLPDFKSERQLLLAVSALDPCGVKRESWSDTVILRFGERPVLPRKNTRGRNESSSKKETRRGKGKKL